MASRSVHAVRTRLFTGLLAAALALAGCGGDDTSEGAVGEASGAVPEAELLSFEADTIDGESVDVSDYAGSDLVIWFWAPW